MAGAWLGRRPGEELVAGDERAEHDPAVRRLDDGAERGGAARVGVAPEDGLEQHRQLAGDPFTRLEQEQRHVRPAVAGGEEGLPPGEPAGIRRPPEQPLVRRVHEAGRVEEATLLDYDHQVVVVTDAGLELYADYPGSDAATQQLLQDLGKGGTQVTVNPQTGKSERVIVTQFLIPILILVCLFSFFMRAAAGDGSGGIGAFSVGTVALMILAKLVAVLIVWNMHKEQSEYSLG